MTRSSRRVAPVLVAALIASATLVGQASNAPIAHYSAQAVDITAPQGRAASQLNLSITRWSTDAERDALNTALWEKGQAALFDALRKMPSVGVIHGTGAAGYDLRFARRTVLPNGSENIVVATDRPIAFWEAATIAESTRYPFAVVELHLRSDGRGEGRMSVAARLSADKNTKTLLLENYTMAQVQLQNVWADKD